MPISTPPWMLGRGSSISSSWLNRWRSSSISMSSTLGLRRSINRCRMLAMLAELRCESGDDVRVSGDVVPVLDEGDDERCERVGEKAVLRRRSEGVRMGVKGDWKRLVRVGVNILGEVVGMVGLRLNGGDGVSVGGVDSGNCSATSNCSGRVGWTSEWKRQQIQLSGRVLSRSVGGDGGDSECGAVEEGQPDALDPEGSGVSWHNRGGGRLLRRSGPGGKG